MPFSLTDFLASLGGEGGTAANTAAALGLGTEGLALANKGYSDVGAVGERAFSEFSAEGGLADKLSGMLSFNRTLLLLLLVVSSACHRTQRRVKCRTTSLLLLKNRLSSSKP